MPATVQLWPNQLWLNAQHPLSAELQTARLLAMVVGTHLSTPCSYDISKADILRFLWLACTSTYFVVQMIKVGDQSGGECTCVVGFA